MNPQTNYPSEDLIEPTRAVLVELRCEACRSLLGTIPDLSDYRGFVLDIAQYQCPRHGVVIMEQGDGSIRRQPLRPAPWKGFDPDADPSVRFAIEWRQQRQIERMMPTIMAAKRKLAVARANRRPYRPFVYLLDARPMVGPLRLRQGRPTSR